MSIQEGPLLGGPLVDELRPKIMPIRNGEGFNERRRVIAEERTGQLVTLVPNLGYLSLSEAYKIKVTVDEPEERVEDAQIPPEQPSLI